MLSCHFVENRYKIKFSVEAFNYLFPRENCFGGNENPWQYFKLTVKSQMGVKKRINFPSVISYCDTANCSRKGRVVATTKQFARRQFHK